MSAPKAVVIRGDGVAAYCCTHLLRNAGVPVHFDRSERTRVPVLLISQTALHLLRDIFANPRLLAGSLRIRHRIVAWQRGHPALQMEHAGLVTSETDLLEQLLPDEAATAPVECSWAIRCGHPLPEGVTQKSFGARLATAWRVRLCPGVFDDACAMEALPEGWLFLLPVGEGRAWLLAVGESGDALRDSRVVAPRIEALESATAPFPCAPRISSPLTGPDWLACGSVALAFDPICGDGTAMAVRAAILASAVVRALRSGGDRESLLHHYEARLRAGFSKHIELCRQYYRSGFGGPWWDRELAALDQHPSSADETFDFRYRLRDLELEAVD